MPKGSIPILYPSIFCVPMPPHPDLLSPASIPSWPILVGTSAYVKAALLFSLLITLLRSIAILIAQRNKTIPHLTMDRGDTSTDQGKGFTSKQRKDSSQDDALTFSTRSRNDSAASQETISDPQHQKATVPNLQSPEHQQNQHLQSLKEETLNPTLIPIHPWIAPPTPLPGPYDAPYYPIPLPTISRHPDSAPAITSKDPPPHIKTEDTLPEELESLSYTHRNHHDPITTLSTTILIYPNRWRRKQCSTTVESAG